MKIHELKYSVSNNYLAEGERGRILFDTGWAGSFPAFCRAVGEQGISVQDIDYILISHFHPDHCGIAQEIADLGPRIAVMDVQKDFVHGADAVFKKDPKLRFKPIEDGKLCVIPISESRGFLRSLGIDGEIFHTPGHSEDSISLWLDSGDLFVGDLNPLYERELHKGTRIGESWEKLLSLHPKKVYYGHAKTAVLDQPMDEEAEQQSRPRRETQIFGAQDPASEEASGREEKDRYVLVSAIMKAIDRHQSLDKIRRKTGADPKFIEDVARMYLTHQNVGVQGILDRIEIKGK